QSILYGATVVPVNGTYDDAFALSICYTKNFGGINRNTAYNPITIEGKKSVSIELYNQMGRKVPDIVYVPVGDGCIISGVAKGFVDLKDAGLIEKLPRIVAVQSTRSNAIAKAFETGEFANLDAAVTIADSISVASPAAGRQAVRRIRESDGWCVQVSDDEIKAAQLELAKDAGIFAEPAASAAYAGVLKDKERVLDDFGANANVLCLLTGTGFKDMKVFEGAVRMPASIDNSEAAVLSRFKKR
ncbi:MAG TPA: pyridoxal-5'-phosphate-dependent protein subunit beta, partial [Spirochaetaceae bacterium]|nr:pyridoxal-5'-phosphate-dependent protein subunit beta [Spirochaetaceae bacterium]